jgi:hypothetical protein
VARHIVYYKGEGGGFPKSRLWWVLWVCVCPWFVCAPKCSNYTLTNLLFGLCRSVWVIELLVNLPSPISELQHAPLPAKCCEPGNEPNSFSFRCLHFWIRSWVHQKAWGCVTLIECAWLYKTLKCHKLYTLMNYLLSFQSWECDQEEQVVKSSIFLVIWDHYIELIHCRHLFEMIRKQIIFPTLDTSYLVTISKI